MKLENEFTVDVPVEEAWNVLLDLERVTPCLPGAALTEESGDEYKGTIKVSLGPITQEYEGTVRIEEADESERRAVIKADGQDTHGQGTASAAITSTLHEENRGESTRVHVETDMQITGRAAQFGRGVQQDVAEKLLSQFAECLENEIVGGGAEEPEQQAEEETAAEQPLADGEVEEEEQPRRRVIQQDQEVEPLDLSEASRDAVLKRVKQAAPVVAGIGTLVVIALLLRRRRR
jgi:carbon monoxide dehydrogenase subunit G